MPEGILVIAEKQSEGIRKVSLQLVSKAASMGMGKVSVFIAGGSVSGLAGELGKYGADKVYTAEGDVYKNFTLSAFAAAASEAVKRSDPALILCGATSAGKTLLPAVAAGAGVSSVSDCTDIKKDGDNVIFTRPIYAGKIIAETSGSASILAATIRPNSFPAEDSGKPEPETESIDAVPVLKETVLEAVRSAGDKVDLMDASAIVAGGRGMGNAENFSLLEDLAAVLGAAVGASRSAVDSGWRSHEDQVGQTGKTVSPALYIACGISGAVQHLAGMSTSKFVLAVNKDPDAPIFSKCSYGIVGDVNEVVPLLTEEFKKIKA
ncbi:MAG: electron transfer flavoprotein subunit alpha/FixB family protein [Fibrobacterota bacterium]